MMQVQKTRVLSATIRRLLHRNARSHIVNMLGKIRPQEMAGCLMELSDRDQMALFTILLRESRELAAETVGNLEREPAIALLQQLSSREVSEILQELESDDAADFIAGLPADLASEVLELMGAKESEGVQELLQHEDETAGRIMTPNVFALREDLSVNEAITAIQTGGDLEMVFYLYVVDDRGHLVGVVSLRQLLMVPPSSPLKKIMSGDIISVTTDTDQEDVARLVALYDLLAIPVVDRSNRLVGVITVDDVIDVIQEEATEDILHLAGVQTDDHVYISRWQSFKRRIPWLTVYLGTALIAAQVVAYYEASIAKFSYLAVFLPVVAGMGGNAGTQTLAVTVRGLALGEISWSTGWSALWKEVVLGIANGLWIGILSAGVAYLWLGNAMLGAILGAAMLINLLVAAGLGTMIPILLKKIRIDPAIASSMLLTTITDFVGFFAFLFMAARYL